jgi:cytochrome c oxidase assembly factor 6
MGLPRFIRHYSFALHEIIHIHLLDLQVDHLSTNILRYHYHLSIPATNPIYPKSKVATPRPSTNAPTLTPFKTSTMGWFGGSESQPTPPPPAPSQDGGFIAPDRTARAQCWDGRDSFFKCLDRHSIIDSVREDKKAREACAPELREFESACASSWVRTVGGA